MPNPFKTLNLPPFAPKIETDSLGRKTIWDVLRKKHVVLTPEEWVRQHIIHALIGFGYPAGKIAIEKGFKIGMNLEKRFDLLVFDSETKPFLAIECKAPDVNVSQKVFDQLFQYNTELKAPYIMVSNGLFTKVMDCQKKIPSFIEGIPAYK